MTILSQIGSTHSYQKTSYRNWQILKFIWKCKTPDSQNNSEKNKKLRNSYFLIWKLTIKAKIIRQFGRHMCVRVSLLVMSDFSTPWTVRSLPGSFVHGILQARILEWVAILFSRGSSQCRAWARVSCVVGRFFTIWADREAWYWHIDMQI